MIDTIEAGDLRLAFEQSGDVLGWPVVLLHGFPYDVRAYDEVASALAAAGARVIVPYLRGYGPTRFLRTETLRSGQQAALASDVIDLLNALGIKQSILAGYDWGGRAACITAVLHPGRVRGLVTGGGYNIQNIPAAANPDTPANEFRNWYQYYFHGERGRAGLQQHRRELCRLLWNLWSPTWAFDDATFERTAASFDNPDFVDVVVHSYRHRYGLVPGDPRLESIEHRLRVQPAIDVPTISLDGDDDGVAGVGPRPERVERFTARHERRRVAGCGHNIPQEAPAAFAAAVLDVEAWARGTA
jgi:pimeloyl-ACP methyl ester carboxylesterase